MRRRGCEETVAAATATWKSRLVRAHNRVVVTIAIVHTITVVVNFAAVAAAVAAQS